MSKGTISLMPCCSEKDKNEMVMVMVMVTMTMTRRKQNYIETFHVIQ